MRLRALGVSQREFAARVGVSEQTVVSWIKQGMPNPVRAYLNLYEDVHGIVERAECSLESSRSNL